MSRAICGGCGKDPAEGFATVNDVRYCHGDNDPTPTCYERARSPSEVVKLGPLVTLTPEMICNCLLARGPHVHV